MKYYKVVKEDLTSVGLLNAPPVQYKLNKWARPLEKLSSHPRKGGGLWVYKERRDAFAAQRYLMKKYNLKTRAFVCRIGLLILHETSYRRKTDKVKLIEEIFSKKKNSNKKKKE